MKRRWKGITALGLSALIGCMAPVSTMMAAAEETETAESVQETEIIEPAAEEVQETEVTEPAAEGTQEPEVTEPAAEEVQESEVTEPAAEETQEPEVTEPTTEEIQETEEAESTTEDTQEPESVEAAAEIAGIMPQAAETAAESEGQEQSEKAVAPVIVIQLDGANRAQALGGTIEYNTYINNRDQRLRISTSQGSDPVSLYYYLDTAARVSDESKNEGQLSDLWQQAEQATGQEVGLGQEGAYVLYVMAKAADGQISYARTDGIVIDTTAPVITGIDNGGTYPEGTYFGVTDDNLESVLMNEQPAALSQTDGMYRVTAAQYSTSCVISAKDKAGNETVYSVTVEKKVEDDINVISKTGDYSLKAGTAYRLGDGNWMLEGDSTVYRGGSTFYVREDGSYHFTQHMK
ncbi:MAG: hypothetical protein HDR09_15985 [Lachnospiraceae bacterium]|nr:hypothetical protein [Lachnospiraceae bacterium]